MRDRIQRIGGGRKKHTKRNGALAVAGIAAVGTLAYKRKHNNGD